MPGRRVPRRLTVAVGVGAAVLGTLAAKTVAPTAPGFGLPDVVAPVLFAGIAVTVMATEARRRLPDRTGSRETS
ncbi:GlsB/YeaQ/YmgE family stress response membrane protein [Actinoplanes sp. NPDC026619]|uniref:GlsB/YeaQ/YmgE family stress response membrane protein n=1 Tax=Actinoplanes sp. NPDC026619 TaxID=3155798 RepID=UPI0033CF7E43